MPLDPVPTTLLAVCATFTAEPIAETLSFWTAELGWPMEIRFAPYNQVFQQLLDGGGLLARNRGGVNLVLVRLEDWGVENLEEHVGQFVASLHAAAQSLPAPLMVCVCPASPAFLADAARRELHARLERRVLAAVAAESAAYAVPMAELEALYPVAEAHDPHADDLGHVPYTPEFFAALGTLLIRKVHALRAPAFKAIVLDCDDTLWKGVCGEDGPQGILLDPPRRALQEFMAAQQAAGMLLCLASKNNLEDVLDTFRLNPRMPLGLDHFTAWRIGWAPKAAAIAGLAEDLDLGLDSFILVDDNPKECGEVQAAHAEVLALALPANADEIPAFLRHVWAFDHLRVTEVDHARTVLYKQQAERGLARRQAASLEQFLESLQLEVRIRPALPSELARVAQLTQRTNQMNFTTARRTESDLHGLLAGGQAECLAVHASDRFGDYGLAGVMIFRADADALRVDTFLLSCRALGRGVEHRMLAALGRVAGERGCAVVEAPFVRTARNLPALLFLESVGLPFQKVEGGRLSFHFPESAAAAVRYQPSRKVRALESEAAPLPTANPAARIPYVRIAAELREPRQILARMQARTRPAEVRDAAPSARSELERQLAGIWAETLERATVGVHEDFFDLGGHSLLAVQLMSRVRREFAVELSLELVYSGVFTVAALAEAIELKEFERSDTDGYAALLQELEGLSEEEVRELLAREDEMPSH